MNLQMSRADWNNAHIEMYKTRPKNSSGEKAHGPKIAGTSSLGSGSL